MITSTNIGLNLPEGSDVFNHDTFLKQNFEKIDTSLAEKANKTELSGIVINAKNKGLKGDGTDETTALLSALTYVADNHYTLFIPKDMTVLVDHLTLANKQNFGIQCEGTIKRLNNSATSDSLITLDTCSNVHLPELNFDGNGLNNGCDELVAYTTIQEHKHSLTISNCTNVFAGTITGKNTCGDLVYLTVNSKKIVIDKLIASADKQIGRNIISIISGQDVYLPYIYGDNVGHFDMPGGFDIEPNANTEVVRNVHIGAVNITGAGLNPFSVQATNGSTVENIFADSVNLVVTNVKAPLTECYGLFLSGSNIHIGKASVKNKTSFTMSCLRVDSTTNPSKGVYIRKLYGEGNHRGIVLGQAASVELVEINATLRNLLHDGVVLYACKNVKLIVDIDSVGASRNVIYKPSATGLTDTVTISGNISKRGTGGGALSSSDVSTNIVNWLLQDLDFTGWASGTKVWGSGFQGTIRKVNCLNLTLGTIAPSGVDQWKQGDIVYNTAPAASGNIGWVCVTSGNPGTWKTFGTIGA